MTDTIDEAPAATDAQATAERWLHEFETALAAGTSTVRPGCSSRSPTGATSSPSRGTSRPWRGRRGRRPGRGRPPGTCAHGFPSPSRRPRPTASPRPGSPSRPRSAAAAGSAPKDGKAWTLLTTLDELKGHEEPRGPRPAAGVEHGADPGSRELARAPPARGRGARGHHAALRRRSSAAGRAASGSARGCASSACRRSSSTGTRGPATVAQPLQVALPARPGLVRPPALHASSPRTGRCSRRRTRSATGSRSYTQGDGAQLLGLDRGQERVWDAEAQEWTVEVEREGQRGDAAPEAARARHRHVGLPERAARSPGLDVFRASSTTRRQHPGPRRLPRQEGVVDRLNNSRARHLRRALGARRRRDHGPALVDPHRALGHADGHRARRAVLRARRSPPASPPRRPT